MYILCKITITVVIYDDTRESPTPDSSMMGHPGQ